MPHALVFGVLEVLCEGAMSRARDEDETECSRKHVFVKMLKFGGAPCCSGADVDSSNSAKLRRTTMTHLPIQRMVATT